jgi:acetyl esterase/lipase
VAGDSAGGNLVTIITIKAIENGLRKPDAIVCFYTPFLLGYR